MNSGDLWLPASQLAALGSAHVIKFPRNEKNARIKARKLKWKTREVECQGGRGGVRTEFLPPQEMQESIRAFLNKNPGFFDKGKEYKQAAPAKPLVTGSGLSSALEVNDHHPHPASLADFVFVPQYDVRASAGHGSIVHSEQIVDHLAFKKAWISSSLGCNEKDLALITVKGDSMEPTLSSNDLILIDLRKNKITENAVYVLQYDGSLLVKRIQRRMDGSVIIKSDNPEYENEQLNRDQADQLKVLGLVVWYGRKM